MPIVFAILAGAAAGLAALALFFGLIGTFVGRAPWRDAA